MDGFKVSLDGLQSLFCRDDRFDHLLGDPDEGVFLGVNVIEGEASILAVVTNEPFICRDKCQQVIRMIPVP